MTKIAASRTMEIVLLESSAQTKPGKFQDPQARGQTVSSQGDIHLKLIKDNHLFEFLFCPN